MGSGRLTRAGQAATAITAILGVGVLVKGQLPRKQVPDVLIATLSKPTLDRPVLLQQYLESRNRASAFKAASRRSRLDSARVTRFLRTPGVAVNYEFELRGSTGMKVIVTAKPYTQHNRLVAMTPHFGQTEHYTTKARRQTVSGITWTPSPVKEGTYYIEVTVQLDRPPPDDETLATKRSDTFRVHKSDYR
ncbi:MAG: hypothetical protein QOJ63_116 [Solirubrobacteraceae bacterium]|jgi:hypothetical protein|nr:hypothetical protein [Solirubrobacteraceae bacterium]